MERALFHSENCYRVPNIRIRGYMCKTNMPSNTAFRGFGGPQVGNFLESRVMRVRNSCQNIAGKF